MRVLGTFILTLSLAAPAHAARIKDLVELEGARDNALVGMGIVVGLAGTGDESSSFMARRPLATLLGNLGTAISPADIRAKNVAIVLVTAKLPPFARPGSRLDVTVSSVGTAKNLAGGTLVATALKGLDKLTYAVAQGQLLVGGYEVESKSGSLARKNHVTVARIPGGGTVEREVPREAPKDKLVLLLKRPDYTTATRIEAALDTAFATNIATVRDGGAVEVAIGPTWTSSVALLIARIEATTATPDAPARVVIDERTGTVIAGADVALGPAAIAYGGLSIKIDERLHVSQPSAFGRGRTQVVPDGTVDVQEAPAKMQVLPAATPAGDVANALNALGVKPRDLLPIFQALKVAGALTAEIEVL